MWKPSDFIIDGEYCDIESIRKVMQELNIICSSKSNFLFVNQTIVAHKKEQFRRADQNDTFFKSLLLLSHKNKKVETKIQKQLAHSKIPKTGFNFNFPIDYLKLKDIIKQRTPVCPFSVILSNFNNNINAQVIQKGTNNKETNDEVSPFQINTYITLLFVGLNCKIKVENIKSSLDSLWCMVNASAPVIIQKYSSLSQRADSLLDKAEPSTNSFEKIETSSYSTTRENVTDYPNYHQLVITYANSLLSNALLLTGSSVGNFYLADSDHAFLSLVADKNNQNPQNKINVLQKESVVAHVYNRRKPLVINNISEFRMMNPSINYLWVGASNNKAYAELAVPIIQRIFGTNSYTVLGVINVEKVEGVDSGMYKEKELNEMRQIALRFCLWRSRALMSFSSTALALLTKYNLFSDISSSNKSGKIVRVYNTCLPAEAYYAKNTISEALKTIYELTISRSATLRLVTRDSCKLYRFCGFPSAVLRHKHKLIDISESKSINAWVVRNGVECYIPNLNSDKPFSGYNGLLGHLEVRKKIISELCVPIFVRGRIVGAMNLESEYKDAYSETKYLVRAIAEHIGLSIDIGRSEMEHEVLSFSATTTLNAHELLKCGDILKNMIRDGKSTVDSDQNTELKSVYSSLRQYANLKPSKLNLRDLNIQKIFTRTVNDLGFDRYVKFGRWSIGDHVIPRQLAQILRLTFGEILFNAYNEAIVLVNGDVRSESRSRRAGGLRWPPGGGR